MSNRGIERRSLTETEIEGLMMAGYCEGAEIDLNDHYRLECVDGQVWNLTTVNDECIGWLNPTNAVVCEEVRDAVERLFERAETYGSYRSFVESEIC